MGQYYKFMNVDKKQICEKNRHGWKLMEHSYLGNDYCDDILRLLSNEWKGDRVLQVGDYAEPNDETTTQNTVEQILKELEVPEGVSLYDYGDSFENINSRTRKDIRYVYNLDKKEYVDLFRQPIQWCYHDDKYLGAVKINSFALLIGCGNGQGGGDYHGVNEELVGYWAGDKFISSSEPIKEYDNFTLRDDIYTEMDYGDLESYYEDEILETEKDIFKSELEKYQKYDHDISKLSFDSYGLLEEEQKVLESIFANNKDKKRRERGRCMYLEDIQKELDNLEIKDLDSAIKGIILGDLQCTLEDNENSKIVFTTVHDIDDIVNELDEFVGEVISNHLCDCIEVVSDKSKEEDICL